MGRFNNFSSSLSMLFSMLLFPSALVSDQFLQVYWTLKPALFEVFNFVYWLTMPEAAAEILLILISFLQPLHKRSMSLFNVTVCVQSQRFDLCSLIHSLKLLHLMIHLHQLVKIHQSHLHLKALPYLLMVCMNGHHNRNVP